MGIRFLRILLFLSVFPTLCLSYELPEYWTNNNTEKVINGNVYIKPLNSQKALSPIILYSTGAIQVQCLILNGQSIYSIPDYTGIFRAIAISTTTLGLNLSSETIRAEQEENTIIFNLTSEVIRAQEAEVTIQRSTYSMSDISISTSQIRNYGQNFGVSEFNQLTDSPSFTFNTSLTNIIGGPVYGVSDVFNIQNDSSTLFQATIQGGQRGCFNTAIKGVSAGNGPPRSLGGTGTLIGLYGFTMTLPTFVCGNQYGVYGLASGTRYNNSYLAAGLYGQAPKDTNSYGLFVNGYSNFTDDIYVTTATVHVNAITFTEDGSTLYSAVVSSIQSGSYNNIIVSSIQAGAYSNIIVSSFPPIANFSSIIATSGAFTDLFISTSSLHIGSVTMSATPSGITFSSNIVVQGSYGCSDGSFIVSSGNYVSQPDLADEISNRQTGDSNLGISTGIIYSNLQSTAVALFQEITARQAVQYSTFTVASISITTGQITGNWPIGNIQSGTFADGVQITTGNINAGGSASAATYLNGSGNWSTPAGGGGGSFNANQNINVGTNTVIAANMTASSFTVTGGNIVMSATAAWSQGSVSAASLSGNINSSQINAGALPSTVIVSSIQSGSYSNVIISSIQAGTTIGAGDIRAGSLPSTVIISSIQVGTSVGAADIRAGTIGSSVIISSIQAGDYEGVQAGTATTANNLNSSTVASYENIRVGTSSVALSIAASNIQAGVLGSSVITSSIQAGSYEGVRAGTSTVAKSLDTSLVASYENIRVGTSSVAMSVAANNVNAGTLGSYVIVSSIQAGDYQGVKVGSATVATNASNIAASGISAGTCIDSVKITTGSIVPAADGTTTKFLRADGTWNTVANPSASNIGAGTLIDTVKITTGCVVPAADGSTTKFLRADGTWNAPANPSAGSITAGTLIDTVKITTGCIVPAADGSTTKYLRADGTWNTVASPGASSITSGTLIDTVKISTGNFLPAADGTTTKFLRADATWASTYFGAANLTAGTLIDTVKVSTGCIVPAADGSTTKFLRADGTWNAPSNPAASSVTAGTFIDTVKITTGCIVPAADASTSKFLRADGTWNAPSAPAAGSITAGTLIDTVKVSTGCLVPVADGSSTKYLCANGTWGTPSISSLGAASITAGTLIDTVKLSTGSIVPAADGSTTKFLRADGTWNAPGIAAGSVTAGTLINTVVISTGNIYPASDGSATKYLNGSGAWSAATVTSLGAASITGGTLIDTVKVTTGCIVPAADGTTTKYLRADGTWNTVAASAIGNGTLGSSVIVSSVQAGSYEHIRAGTSTVVATTNNLTIQSYGFRCSSATTNFLGVLNEVSPEIFVAFTVSSATAFTNGGSISGFQIYYITEPCIPDAWTISNSTPICTSMTVGTARTGSTLPNTAIPANSHIILTSTSASGCDRITVSVKATVTQ